MEGTLAVNTLMNFICLISQKVLSQVCSWSSSCIIIYKRIPVYMANILCVVYLCPYVVAQGCGPALPPRELDLLLVAPSPSLRLMTTEVCCLLGLQEVFTPMTPTWWTYSSWYDHSQICYRSTPIVNCFVFGCHCEDWYNCVCVSVCAPLSRSGVSWIWMVGQCQWRDLAMLLAASMLVMTTLCFL